MLLIDSNLVNLIGNFKNIFKQKWLYTQNNENNNNNVNLKKILVLLFEKKITCIGYTHTEVVKKKLKTDKKFILNTPFHFQKSHLKAIHLKYLVVPLEVNTLYISML